jgi:hypothetical protein
MVKVSTLFYRVDGFEKTKTSNETRELSDQLIDDQFLKELIGPLLFDPGDEIVQRILHNV